MPVATEPTSCTIKIDGLGELTGWLNPDGSKQFFNIPYGVVTKRFTNSTLKTTWADGGGRCEGRYLGAASSQPQRPFYPFPLEKRPHLKYTEMEITDEFACLNLHITVPPGVELGDSVPVLTFIHGGGFVFGTANYSLLDGRRLACLSAEIGMPTIIVTPNYRLGFFGFLASNDIGLESELGNGNFGLIDQKNALLWVNKYIGSFGGDAGNVLLSGVSAGGISVDAHMRAPWNHLFQTAVLQSGTIPICGHYSIDEYDVIYRKLCSEVGVSLSLPPQQRLAALRAVDPAKISHATYEVFQGLNLPQFGIAQDGMFLGEGSSFPRPGQYWKEDLSKVYPGKVIVGDCKNEGIIYDQAFRDYSVDHIRTKVRQYLEPGLAAEYLDHYNVHDGMADRERYDALESMVTDGIFGASPFYLAEANSDKVHVYHWDHASQFENAWGGYAHHSLDYMWLFGNVSHIITPDERQLVRSIGSDFIAFANGQSPYPVYGSKKVARRYGPLSSTSIVEGREYTGRPAEWLTRMGPSLDDVDKLCTDFIMRRPELVSPEYGPGSENRIEISQRNPLAL